MLPFDIKIELLFDDVLIGEIEGVHRLVSSEPVFAFDIVLFVLEQF